MNDSSANWSGSTRSVWHDGVAIPALAPLEHDAQADACVVGAGIAGLTTAYLLARSGKRVIVLDEKPIGGGETGRTSAHLASIIDDRFSALESMHGLEATKIVHQSHVAAIDLIERIVREHAIECNFARVDGLLVLADGEDERFLEKEFRAAERAGVVGAELNSISVSRGGAARPCIRFHNQARFHPLRYLEGLARELRRLGVQIHTGDRVTSLEGDGPVEAKLSSGHTVRASVGIAATNVPTPINNWMGVYTKEAAYRTYVIALQVAPDLVPDALIWDTADPYHYVRLDCHRNHTLLIVGGEDHKTGQADGGEVEALTRLEAWARSWFPGVGAVQFHWSGQVSEPEDGIAYIGRVPTSKHAGCYVITGDSGMGLTHGTLGAILINDLIAGRETPWVRIYDPARKPWGALGSFLKENVNAAVQMADYIGPSDVSSIEEIRPGAGAVVREGVHRLAVYRDPAGQVHQMSAVCPHLRCVVRWNALEHSWDCPCHGSRFDCRGKLIMGPAIKDLPPHPSATQS